MKEFSLKLKVAAEDIDALDHVNNVVYLQWIQTVSAEHWFASAGTETGIIWVVRKHEIEYLKPAFIGDDLQIKTWVEAMSGIRSLRRVEILRGEDIICSSLSEWIALNPNTQRPVRLSENICKLFR